MLKGIVIFIIVDWVLIFFYWELIFYFNLFLKRILLYLVLCDSFLFCFGFVGVFFVEFSFFSDIVRFIIFVFFCVFYKVNLCNICKCYFF